MGATAVLNQLYPLIMLKTSIKAMTNNTRRKPLDIDLNSISVRIYGDRGSLCYTYRGIVLYNFSPFTM